MPHGSPPITSFAPPASREFAGHLLACNPCLPFSSRPLYESSRLADPYTPVSEGVLLDFYHPPQVLCNPRGQGAVRLLGAIIYQAVPPLVVMRDSVYLPRAKGIFLTPTHPRVQVSRSQLVSDLQNQPPCHLPLPQLSMAMNLVPRTLIC